jgi:lipopolysaccharide transport system permease protein
MSGVRPEDAREEVWTSVITPGGRWFDIDLAELWRFRELVALFVRRDFIAVYQQTVLGSSWHLLKPLLSTAVFYVVFGRIARIPTDGVPPALFYLSGLILWTHFSTCLNRISGTFRSNAAIFGKVYFPRLTVPLSIAASSLGALAVQFALLLLVWIVLPGQAAAGPTGLVALLPLLLLQVTLLGSGVGLLFAALTIRYRDLEALLASGIQLWMFATPIVYPLSQVPARWRWLSALNPMTFPVEAVRAGLFGGGSVRGIDFAGSAAVSLALFVAGVAAFSRAEKDFVDTV